MTTPTPIVVSYSELDAYRQCGHKHDLGYRQHWTPRQTAPALNRGIIWHKVMQFHYQAIQDGMDTMTRRKQIVAYLMEVKLTDPEEADLIAWMYDGYEDVYGIDSDWEIVAIEQQHLVRLPLPSGRPSRFYLRLRIDLLVRERIVGVAGARVAQDKIPLDAQKLWLVDHKSGKNLPTDTELDIHDQFGLYTWALRQEGFKIFGSIHNAAQTYQHKEERPPEQRVKRSKLYRTDRELDTIASEAAVTAKTAYSFKSGEAPRSPDPDRCRWRCPFTEGCLVGRKSGSHLEQLFMSAAFDQLTPDEALAQRGYENPIQPPEPAISS